MAPDVWRDAAGYESYVGRWSRPVASGFVGWLGVPAGGRWLDVGCGTGALTGTVLDLADPATVTGVDSSTGYVRYARTAVPDPKARFAVADATTLPFADARFDAVVSGLVLNFLPDPDRALAGFVRVTAPGGTVACYVWDYADGMEPIRRFWDAAVTLDPSAARFDEGRRFPLCRPGPLTALWRRSGLDDVTVRAVDVPARFRDFDDYWAPFLGGQGPAPGYAMSLPDGHRDALRRLLADRLPIGPDGTIRLAARAFAVRGRR